MKRQFDVALGGILLILTAPVFLLAALAVAFDGGAVFFRQTRAGLFGRPFLMLKFRSMRAHQTPALSPHEVTSTDPLVTSTGKWLRRFKIDELPQLLNVIRGDMSLVGPRPALLEQAAEYGDYECRRLAVKPGMTGWTQVNGGIEISWPDRILLDVWYVDHCSLLLDLKILLRTFAVVFFGDASNHSALRAAKIHAAHPGWGD
ncbi:MAG TPA: sugar transferase [Acidisarcina sp.]